jgi:hypothetical protein
MLRWCWVPDGVFVAIGVILAIVVIVRANNYNANDTTAIARTTSLSYNYTSTYLEPKQFPNGTNGYSEQPYSGK